MVGQPYKIEIADNIFEHMPEDKVTAFVRYYIKQNIDLNDEISLDEGYSISITKAPYTEEQKESFFYHRRLGSSDIYVWRGQHISLKELEAIYEELKPYNIIIVESKLA